MRANDCPGKTELHADILLRPDARVFVEFEPQSRIEGELQQMPANFAVTEFASLVSGQAKARLSEQDVTIFDSVGFALEDFSALRFMMDSAVRLGLGQRIDEFTRIVPGAVLVAPVFTRKLRAERLHCAADFRDVLAFGHGQDL
mgnify:CR=1 FL=1